MGMDYFTGIIGQDRAIDLLRRSMASDNINHAYLFAGPAGIGKTTTALAFAYNLLAAKDSGAQIFLKDKLHPDLLIIEKPENKTVIGKEQITKGVEPWLAVKPFRANRKLVIIKDSNAMSLEAANALLKTLEEPPGYAVIILISDENNLLETILSRCQLVRFFPIRDEEIEKFLINKGLEQKKVYQAARLAQGSLGAAQRYANEEEFDQKWSSVIALVEEFSRGQYQAVFDASQQMEANPNLYTSIMETILRDIYIFQKTNLPELLVNPDNQEVAATIPKIKPEKIRKALNRINSLKKYYRSNVNSFLISTNITYEVFAALN